MKKIFEISKRVFLYALAVLIIATILPNNMFNITTNAATSWVGSSTYGWYANDNASLSQVKNIMSVQTSDYMMSRFDKILNEYPLSGYFNSYKTKGCLWHCGKCGKVQSSCINSFYDDEQNEIVELNSTQCWGYAQYCFYRFFKTFHNTTITLSANFSTATLKSTINNSLIGSHFRAQNHSMVYLGSDANNLYFIDANSGYNTATGCASGKCANNSSHYSTECKINLRKFSWSEFQTKYSSSGVTIYAPTSAIENSTSITHTLNNDDCWTSDNNIFISYNLNKPSSYTVSDIGIKLRKDGESYTSDKEHKQATDNGNHLGKSSVAITWDFKNELDWSLTHATKYYYKLYAKVNGTEYWSDEYSITTTGTHSYGSWTTTKSATCRVNGSAKRSCTICGNTETKTLPKLEHQYTLEHETAHPHKVYEICSCKYWNYTGDYAQVKTCSECWHVDFNLSPASLSMKLGETKSASIYMYGFYPDTCSLNLDYDKSFLKVNLPGNNTIKFTALKAGTGTFSIALYDTTKTHLIGKESVNITISDSHTHNYSAATCTAPKTCKVCKATSGKALGHTYSNNCDKSCNVCGNTRTVGAHKYSNSCDTTCNYCGAKRTIKHTYSNNCDTSCNVCNATRKITHSYKTTSTTKATLSKNGKTVKKCTVCGSKTTATIKYAKTFKLSTTSYTYNGKAKKPTVTVKDSAGKTISSKYYTVTYKNNTKVGKATVTIKMKGNYKGTKTLTFTIKPAKTTVSKLTAGKKSVTVSIKKKSTQVTGYQIQYSTSKKFTSAKTKTVSSYKTTKYTLKSLSAKKTYYVRVRTYKTVNGKKYYSGWSDYKKVKTK